MENQSKLIKSLVDFNWGSIFLTIGCNDVEPDHYSNKMGGFSLIGKAVGFYTSTDYRFDSYIPLSESIKPVQKILNKISTKVMFQQSRNDARICLNNKAKG